MPVVSWVRRRPRFLRRRERDDALGELMADLARLEAPRPEPEVGIDPEERALLVQLYRELVGTIEGPIVPFPVELMEDPAYVQDRAQPAALLDLDEFRLRRLDAGVRPDADPGPDAGSRTDAGGAEPESAPSVGAPSSSDDAAPGDAQD